MPEYELVRSRRKTLCMEIRQGRVIVRAPLRATGAQISAFVAAHAQWLKAHLEKSAAREKAHPEPSMSERAALIARAKAILPGRIEYYAGIMGVNPSRLSVTDARTRFGSCSSKGSICFSWRLMLYPDAAIDYVVVHELAHLRHMNHGKEFYAEIARVLPDYEKRRELLKR